MEKNNLQQIINVRLEKLTNIRNAGYNPFPYNFHQRQHDWSKMLVNDVVYNRVQTRPDRGFSRSPRFCKTLLTLHSL